MPKLAKKIAQKVEETEGGVYEAFPEGTFIGTLKEVTVSDEPGPSGAHYWRWTFDTITGHSGEDVEQGKVYPGNLFVNTSLADNALWKMKEVFEAFGYTPDSDTDEMCGEKVKLVVSQRVIEKGSRKGDIGNNVDRVLSLDSEEDDEEGTF